MFIGALAMVQQLRGTGWKPRQENHLTGEAREEILGKGKCREPAEEDV